MLRRWTPGWVHFQYIYIHIYSTESSQGNKKLTSSEREEKQKQRDNRRQRNKMLWYPICGGNAMSDRCADDAGHRTYFPIQWLATFGPERRLLWLASIFVICISALYVHTMYVHSILDYNTWNNISYNLWVTEECIAYYYYAHNLLIHTHRACRFCEQEKQRTYEKNIFHSILFNKIIIINACSPACLHPYGICWHRFLCYHEKKNCSL